MWFKHLQPLELQGKESPSFSSISPPQPRQRLEFFRTVSAAVFPQTQFKKLATSPPPTQTFALSSSQTGVQTTPPGSTHHIFSRAPPIYWVPLGGRVLHLLQLVSCRMSTKISVARGDRGKCEDSRGTRCCGSAETATSRLCSAIWTKQQKIGIEEEEERAGLNGQLFATVPEISGQIVK